MFVDRTFEDAVKSARVPQPLQVGAVSRSMYDISGIPGVDRLPRALVVLLENVVRTARTDEEAVQAARRIVEAGTSGAQGEEIEFMPARDRKSTRLNSSHRCTSRMPSSA